VRVPPLRSKSSRRDPLSRNREEGYIKGLRAIAAKYPDDPEAKSYLALQLMSGFELPAKSPRPGSMEAADLFVWCATEGGGLPAGAVNAVFANRHTNEWGLAGEELAAEIALDAFVSLSEDASLSSYRSRQIPKYA